MVRVLTDEIAVQERIAADPAAAEKRVGESIERAVQRQRRPEKSVSPRTTGKFINPPPGPVPSYFQGRHSELDRMADFMQNEDERMLAVVGRGGVGKTAVVCKLLKDLENGRLPENRGPFTVAGIVYLSQLSARKVNFPAMFAGLCRLLPDDRAERMDALYKDPHRPASDKILELAALLPPGPVVVVLDNFEDKMDPETRDTRDKELGEALAALLKGPRHGVKLVVTTRLAPRGLALVEPGRFRRLDLDKGLESPYAENILRQLDREGKLGLRDADERVLNTIRTRTLGFPRALEALAGILAADMETTLADILADTEKLLPEHVTEKLVGEAFSRLDTAARMVMEALAVYGRGVSPAAVDYMLRPFLPGVDSASVLNRLVNMFFVRKEAGAYYLHPVDGEYAGTRLPEGGAADLKNVDTPPFTRYVLLRRGADFCRKMRLPRKEWKTISDIAPQLAEIDLRVKGRDYDTAAEVLIDIDKNYLYLWGHFRLMVELHEGMSGKISAPNLKESSVGHLGTAYSEMGEYRQAITCYEVALKSARMRHDRLNEGVWLGNLGNRYADLGRTDRAIDYYEQALTIAREIADREGEARHLGNLGIRYADLGQTDRAIDYYKQALSISCEIGDREGEARHLGNLGIPYACLGQTARACEYYEQSMAIAQNIGYRLMESADLIHIGDVLADQQKLDEAVQYYRQAIVVADEIGYAQTQNEARYRLAQVSLYSGDLAGARNAIDEAGNYNYPKNNPALFALSGLVYLRQGDRQRAHEAFTSAITDADALLGYTAENYEALDTKGLALCGLALCENENNYIDEAVKTYTSAREINKDIGYVNKELRKLTELSKADTEGMLKPVLEYFSAVGE